MIELMEDYGSGVLIALPASVTVPTVLVWTKTYVIFLRCALKNSGEQNAFGDFCHLTNGWIEDMVAHKLEGINAKKTSLSNRS